MASQSTILTVPDTFSFRATIYSHGWCELLPFEIDAVNWRLTRVLRDAAGATATVVLSEHERGLEVEIDGPVDATAALRDIRHMLRLDDEMDEFYQALASHEHLQWVERTRAGRLLRSPTVFEDLIKTVCTTNCSWSLTKIMVSNIVKKLGDPASDGRSAFPTPEQMASVDASFYRDEIRAGYRSEYLVEMVRAVAGGSLDPEAWLHSESPTPELKLELKKVKGVGDYAAENLLKLLGRYDGLALDSWLRSQFYKKYNSEKKCPDKRIEHHYKRFGKWRGLVIWCDMTERWVTGPQV